MAGKLFKQYKEDQGAGNSSLYKKYKSSMDSGLSTGNSTMDRYIEHRRQEEETAKERKQLRDTRINRETRERQVKNASLNKDRAAMTDFMRQEREKIQSDHAAEASQARLFSGSDLTKMKSLAETAKKKRDTARQNYLEKKENDAKGVAEYGPFKDGAVHITPYEEITKRPDFQTGAYQGAKNDQNPVGSGNAMKGFWSNVVDGLKSDPLHPLRATASYNHSFQAMTDNQRTMYNYLFHRYGADQADRYASSLDDELNMKAGRQGAEAVSAVSGVPAFGLNMLASTAAGTERAVKGLGQAVDMVTGNYETDPVSNFDGYLQHLQEKSSGAARVAYDLANSTGFMLPSMLAAPAAGAAMGATAGSAFGSAMFGAAAGGNSYADSIREGQDVETAQLYGALNAASETVTQAFLGGLNNVSLGHPKVKGAIDTAVRKMVSNPAVRDRMIQAAGYGADMAAEGLQEYTQELLDKASRNMLFGEDNKISLADPEVWYAAMLGALNAGVLNAPGAIAQELDYRSTGKNIVPEYSEFAEGINTDQSYAAAETQQEARDLQELAQRYAQQQENGESIPARDNGRFLERMENFTENVQQSEEITQNQDKNAQNTGENAQNMTDDVSEEIVQKPEVNPQNVLPAPVETQLETGSTEDDTLGELSEQYGKYGKNAYVDYYDHETDLPQYSRTFDRVYDAGRWGIKMDEAVHQEALSTLGREKLENIWKAGAQDRDAVMSNVNRETGEPLNMTQGEAHIGGIGAAAENATSAQKTFAQYMGTRTGLTFDLVDGMEQGGAVASYEKGKVTLDINSKDFLGSASHELTHFIRDYAPGEYNEYADTVIRQIMKSEGMDLQDGTESYINNYMSQAGQQLTREQAVEEIVADASQKFFNDEEFIKEVTQNRSLGQKILDFIDDVIDAIKNLIKTGSTRQPAKALEENLVYFQRARRDYMAGLDTASERYKAGYEVQNETMHYKIAHPELTTNEQIEKNFEKVRKSDPVVELEGDEFTDWSKKKPSVQVEEFYNSIGNKVHNDVIGDVILNKASVKRDIAHGIGKLKAITFKAVPDVIKNGEVLNVTPNWKGRPYDSVAVGARVDVKGGDRAGKYYVICTLHSDDTNRMYLHETGAIKMDTLRSKTGSILTDETSGAKYPSIDSLLEKLAEVNVSYENSENKKFQLKDPVEETGTLIAAHNLTEDKLKKMLEYDGIPMPSIAITKADQGWNKFGDISLIFRKETIDPEGNRKNKVYGADAWTPTFPRIEYDVNDDVYYRALNTVSKSMDEKVPAYLKEEARRFISTQSGNAEYDGVDGVVESAKHNLGMKAAYLASEGIQVQDRAKQVETPDISPEAERFYKSLLNKIPDQERVKKIFDAGYSPKEMRDAYGSELLNIFAQAKIENGVDPEKAYKYAQGCMKQAFRFANVMDKFKAAFDYQQNGVHYNTETVRDEAGIRNEIESQIDEKEYESWIRNLYDGLVVGTGVYNGKEYLTPSGNRRSFKQTHYEVTPENIVKSMLSQGDGDAKNVVGFMGIKTIRAAASGELKSISDMHKAEGKIQNLTEAEFSEKQDALNNRLMDVIQNIIERTGYSGYSGIDAIGNLIEEAAGKKNFSEKSVRKVFADIPYWKVSDQDFKEITDIVNEVKEMPVDMFEAKPQRVVGYDEVAAAIVPEGTDESVMTALADRGIKTVSYDLELEGDRNRAVNSVNGIRFQIDMDTDGNELSEQQQNFFQDSKIRNEDGKLKVMYHGSPNDFTVFDKKKARSSGYYGKGFYFSDSESYANTYGRNYKVYLNIKNPLQPGEHNITRQQMRKFIQAIAKDEDYGIDNYGYDATVTSVLNEVYGKDDFGMLQDIDISCVGDMATAIKIFNKVNKTNYDGIVVPTETVAFEANQIKNVDNKMPTENPDIRFQMEDMDDYLFYDDRYVKNIIKENQELKEANELLKKEFTLTAKDKLRQDDIRKACGKVLKEYNSKAKLETVASNVTKLFEYVRSGDRIAWDEASEAATAIGRSILEQAQQKDTALTEQYKDLRKQIKDTKILITDQDKADLAAAGGYNSFRQKYFGRMSLGKTGISVDTLYQELSSQHPDLFDPDITHPADQLMQIGNVLDMTQPQVLNPYHANMDEMAYHVGQELLQEYWNVRQPAPTFADRKAEELRKVRQQYNNKLDAYKQKMGDQYTAMLNEARRENADMREAHARELYWQKEKFNTKMKDRREALAKREAKESVIKESARLRKWLLEPNDKQHIPEELRTVVADFLSNIDFSSKTDYNGVKTQRTMAWEEALKAFNKIKETGQITDQDGNVRYVDIDPDQAARMEELNKKIKGIDRLEELDSYSLQELLKTVRSMKSAITEINELKTNKKYGEVSLLAENVFRDTNCMKGRKEFRGPVGQVDSLLNVKMMDPVTVFHKLGPAMETVYDSLTTGWDKKTKLLKEASDYFSEALEECELKPKDIRGWTGKNPERHSFKLSGGDITLSTGQIMALYELDKRGQARKHIYDQKGGIKAGDIDLGTSLKEKRLLPERLRGNKPVRVTEADVKKITAVLTDNQRALADKMQRFLGNNAAEWGNEASREMYGYDKYKSRNYFPITTDKDYIMQPEGNKKDSTIRNLGMTKSTNAYANNPIIVDDIFDVFTRHVDQMSSYNGLLVPLSDLHKLLNYKDARGFNDSSIQERIKATLGTGTAKYLDNLVDDINGSVHTRNDTGIADMLMGNMKAAAVAGNLRVAVQQPGSIARAYAELDAKYIAKGLTKGANWDVITEYAPIAQWKDWGFYQMQVSRRMKDILVETDSEKDRFVNKTMVLAELGDQVTWKRLWNAVEYETMDRHPDLQKGSKEFYTEVGHRFSEIIYKTQVADSVMLRTEVMRSKDALAKMATAFMGEPLKTYNMLYRAVWDLKAGRLDKKTARNNAMRVAAAFTANAFLTAAAAAAVDMFRDDDREKDLGEKFQSHMAANMIDNVNILNSVPYVRDVLSTVQGNTVKRTDMQGIQDVYYAWKKVYKAIQKTGKYTPQYAFLEALRSTSALTGIPIKSITKDALAVIDTAVGSLSGTGEYEATKMKYGMSLKDNKSLYVSMMMNASEAGDKALADKIKQDLLDAGYTEDDIEKQMNQEVNKEIKDNIDIISAADKYDYQDKESRDVFEEEVSAYIELKKKAGKSEKDALQSVKTKLSSHYKEMYQKGDQKTKKEVIEKCNRFRYNGNAIFKGSEYKSWAKK